ncbi:MAG: VCBS repeat-containing protein, partial [Chromatiales bacterium]
MKDRTCFSAIFAITLFVLVNDSASAAIISFDLDSTTPGIQTSRTLTLGSEVQFEVVFTGDGTTLFDTFALDVVYNHSGLIPSIHAHSPTAGSLVDSAPLMALDLYSATSVSAGDALTQGNMPMPLGFDDGLGGVGASSLGGSPFPLLGPDETIGLFRFNLTALHGGTSTLALSGYPFGVGAELSLAGESVPVSLQGATVTVVPLPPAVWLFVTGGLILLGIRHSKGIRAVSFKPIPRRWLLLALALISPLGFAAVDSNADLNGDAMVTSQDISLLASCFAQDPASNSACAPADVDEDGDIDVDDFSFVSARLGQAYPWTLYPIPSFIAGEWPVSVTSGDIDGDGALDLVVANSASDDISVLLGHGDGGFQEQQRYAVGVSPGSVALGDVNGDGALDVVVANEESDDISLLLGQGDGGFQEQQRYAAGSRPESVALGDVNGDGALDAVVANGGSADISVLLGRDDGGFQEQLRYAAGGGPRSVALGDVNGDGALDLVVVNGWEYISVLLGLGDGGFQEPQRFVVGHDPVSVALGDVNGDGALDVVVANFEGGDISVLLGRGDGGFQEQQSYVTYNNPVSVALGDVNGDGALDLVVANCGYSDQKEITVLLGQGDGGFQEPRYIFVGNARFSVTLGDVNGDGALDLVVTQNTSNIFILLGRGDGSFKESQGYSVGSWASRSSTL